MQSETISPNPRLLSNARRSLWLVPPERKATIQSALGGAECELEFVESLNELHVKVLANRPHFIVAHIQNTNRKTMDFFEELRRSGNSSVRIAWLDSQAELDLDLINRCGIFQVLDSSMNPVALQLSCSKILEYSDAFGERLQFVRQVSLQNRNLEALTGDLEKLVNERTKDLADSKSYIEREERKTRDLIRFMVELSKAEDLHEWYTKLLRELRPMHQIIHVYLAFQNAEGSNRIIFARGTQVVEKEAVNLWPQSKEVRSGLREDQQFLVEQLERPVSQLISIPVTAPFSEVVPVLFIEHQSRDSERAQLEEFLGHRIQILNLIFERLFLESHLKFSSQRWEKTFDVIRDPISIIDESGRILKANRFFSPLLQTQKCYQAFAKREEECRGCPKTVAFQKKSFATGQVRVGSHFFEVISFPLQFSNQRSFGAVINHYRDVTQQKELMSRIIQHEKMAALGLLAGNIAHELNNPLTGLRSLTQLLLQDAAFPAELKEDFVEIEKASERCQAIIRNLLEFSQSSQTSTQQVIDLNDVVERTLPFLKASMRFIDRHVIPSDTPVWIKADGALIQQVIYNLVQNACDVMKEGGTLTIQTRLEGQVAQLDVQDTGPGIDSENQKQIFEAFFTTKPRGQGTGLGLYLSRSILKRFQGTLEIFETSSRGTTFRVELPSAKII